MINPEQIKITKNAKIVTIARLDSLLNRKFNLFILRALSFAGLFAFLLLGIGYISFDFGQIVSFFLRVVFFMGILSFPAYIFIRNYFREAEGEISIPSDVQSYEFFNVCGLETVKILSSVNLDNPDIADLYKKILASQRVSFIAGEMGLSPDFNQKIFSGLPRDKALINKIFACALDNAIQEGSRLVTTADIFYGILRTSATLDVSLIGLEINEDDLSNIVFWANSLYDEIQYPRTIIDKLHYKGAGMAENWTSGYTLFLDRFSYDITNPRFFGNFSVEGREQILTQIENTLSKEAKNNCILTGGNGSGKTSLVYGFAEKIFWGDTLPELSHKRIVCLDTQALLSGVSEPGEAEEVLQGVLNDAVRAGNIILFIDDIHTIFTGGRDKVGTIDASEIIAPYLGNSNLRIIGVSTDTNYQTYIRPHTNIAGNFERIEVPETDENQTIRILEDLSLYFSSKYGIQVTYNALKETYRLSERFVSEKGFPAKAVDMLENICTAAKNNGEGVLDRHSVDDLTEKVLNVPVAEAAGDEKEKLLNLDEKLHTRVIGQDEAIKAVADALRRARTQVTDSKKPIGTFLFLGPTGVGKTELTKALAWAYFGNAESMIRMDMSEFQEVGSIERFLGKRSSTGDKLEGGDFVKKIREKPFSVVLLDELEKAHPDILNLFLQVLDEGYITDGMGIKVSFQNCIIIATSNAGANLIREGVASGKGSEDLKGSLLDYLQSQGIYKPEFLNRFDGCIVFKPLTKDELMEIATLMFGQTCASLKQKGYIIQIEKAALAKLVELGYQPEFGARPMRRVFQDKLESVLAKKILEGTVQKGVPFVVKTTDLEDVTRVVGNS